MMTMVFRRYPSRRNRIQATAARHHLKRKPINWESPTMKRSGLFSRQTAVLFACGSAAGWHSACADESSTTAGAIEEIVVTAQKRAEPASEVPQSITAISGDVLRSSNTQTLA